MIFVSLHCIRFDCCWWWWWNNGWLDSMAAWISATLSALAHSQHTHKAVTQWKSDTFDSLAKENACLFHFRCGCWRTKRTSAYASVSWTIITWELEAERAREGPSKNVCDSVEWEIHNGGIDDNDDNDDTLTAQRNKTRSHTPAIMLYPQPQDKDEERKKKDSFLWKTA